MVIPYLHVTPKRYSFYTMCIFEYDPNKSQLNFDKHDIDFEEAKSTKLISYSVTLYELPRGGI